MKIWQFHFFRSKNRLWLTTTTQQYILYNQMPRPSTGPKIFCTGPYFLCQTKDWIIICATSKYFVPAQILNLVNGNHIYRLAQNVEDRNNMCKWIFGIAQKSWTRPKHFGTCRRTRQKSFKWLCKQLCSQSFNMCKGPLYLKHVLDETLHRVAEYMDWIKSKLRP